MDDRNVILEIRAGTGGDEAALFAGDLYRMYERYAAKQGWKVEIATASEGAMGGYKEVIAEIRGRGHSPSSNTSPACIAFNASPTPRRQAAFIPRPRLLRFCRGAGGRRRHQRGDLKIDTLRSGGAGASMSTRPNPRCA